MFFLVPRKKHLDSIGFSVCRCIILWQRLWMKEDFWFTTAACVSYCRSSQYDGWSRAIVSFSSITQLFRRFGRVSIVTQSLLRDEIISNYTGTRYDSILLWKPFLLHIYKTILYSSLKDLDMRWSAKINRDTSKMKTRGFAHILFLVASS
jgi:hypothetical protein